jgi:hypothetical protein
VWKWLNKDVYVDAPGSTTATIPATMPVVSLNSFGVGKVMVVAKKSREDYFRVLCYTSKGEMLEIQGQPLRIIPRWKKWWRYCFGE